MVERKQLYFLLMGVDTLSKRAQSKNVTDTWLLWELGVVVIGLVSFVYLFLSLSLEYYYNCQFSVLSYQL